MKKLLVVLFAVVATFCFAAGCGNNSKNQGDEKQPTISLNYETLSLYPYESRTLVITTELTGERKWVSSNTAVATVDQNGVVNAISQGESVVSITIGNEKAECFVTVNKETQIPKFEFNNIINNEIGLLVGGTFSLNQKIKVTFKGEDVEDAKISLSSNDNQIVEIIDGTLIAKKLGTAEITILGEWREFDGSILNERIIIKVRNDITFELTVPEIEVYGISELCGEQFNTEVTVQPHLLFNGNEITEGFIFSTEDESIAIVDENGVVTGKGAGKTSVICKYVDGEEIIIKKEINILHAVVDYQPENEIVLVQNKDKNVSVFDGIFTSGVEILTISDVTDVNEKVFSIAQNGLFSAGTEGFATGDRIYRIYNSVFAYNLPVVVADREITTADEFKSLFLQPINDYVVLGADIENVGIIEQPASFINHLYGTINGNGHVVSGLIVKGRALIEEMRGTIKNIAFVNASQQTIKDANDTVLNCATIAVTNNGGTFDNVFLQTKMVGGSALVLINTASATIKNCVVSAEWDTEQDVSAYKAGGTGGLFTYCNGGNGTITNVFGLSRSNPNNYGVGWSGNQDSKPYSNSNILVSTLESSGLNEFNSFWNIIDGELYFSNTLVISKMSTTKLELPEGQKDLFLFSKNVDGHASTYGAKYYNGGHAVKLPIDVGGVGSVEFVSTDGNSNLVKPTVAGYDSATKTVKFGWASINSVPVGEYEIVIYATDGNTYVSNILVADFVLFIKAEFVSAMNAYDKSGAAPQYIALGADIDFGGETFKNENITADAITFNGTFDGRGFAIKNVNVGSNGIFGYLGSAGVIKNLALINATQGEIGGSLLVAYSWAGTIENVFVQGTTGGIGGILYNDNGSTVNVKNCIAVVDSTNSGNWGLERGTVVANASDGSKANAQYNYAVSSNFSGSFGTDNNNLYASNSDLLTALNGQLPSGFNAYWSFNVNGDLCFGANVVVAK